MVKNEKRKPSESSIESFRSMVAFLIENRRQSMESRRKSGISLMSLGSLSRHSLDEELSDLRDQFVTIRKQEYNFLQSQLEKALDENDVLRHENECLAAEVDKYKAVLAPIGSETKSGSHKTVNLFDTSKFITTQGVRADTPVPALSLTLVRGNANGLPNGVNSSMANKYGSMMDIDDTDDSPYNFELLRTTPPEKRPSVFSDHSCKSHPETETDSEAEDLEETELATISRRTQERCWPLIRQFLDYLKNGQQESELAKRFLAIYKKNEAGLQRQDYLYILLATFIVNGVSVSVCNHYPPCHINVVSRGLERSVQCLKKLMQILKVRNQHAIEVELLVALEQFVADKSEYLEALKEICDIFFVKGVVSSAAFGDWSEHSPTNRKRLILRKLKTAGFNVIHWPA